MLLFVATKSYTLIITLNSYLSRKESGIIVYDSRAIYEKMKQNVNKKNA